MLAGSPRQRRALTRGLAWLLVATALGACSRPGFLVRTSPATVPYVNSSRAEIATRVAELEQLTSGGSLKGNDRKEAMAELTLLRNRLEQGDFQVGDQIIVTVARDTVGVDTASVREGQQVAFAALPDVSLAGVLRSELLPRLQAHVDRYIKQATVRVNVTTRLQIVGQVTRPGFYSISPDRPVSEVLMLAGGPTPIARIDEVTIRRDQKVIVKPKQWQEAVKVGTTVAQLGLRPGDEIEITGKKGINWQQVVQIGFLAVSGTLAVIQVLRLVYAEN
jgi:hypothetical protein